MDDTAFKPFVPPEPMFADPPAAGKLPPPPTHEKKPRKKRTRPKASKPAKKPKAVVPAPPKAPKRKKKRTVIEDGPVTQVAKAIARGDAKRREKRATVYAVANKKVVGKTPKLSFATAMELTAMLRKTDAAVFGTLMVTLGGVNKVTRTRLLAAIEKVFA